MSGSSDSIVTKLVDRVFPRMPDFYGLMNEQCDVLVEGMEAFVELMETGTQEHAQKVRDIEKKGDELKARNIDILNRAFATPMDREDIARAIETLDTIINYAKTTTREMEILEVAPDKYMAEIAIELKNGADRVAMAADRLHDIIVKIS